jgi:hypothetical protein
MSVTRVVPETDREQAIRWCKLAGDRLNEIWRLEARIREQDAALKEKDRLLKVAEENAAALRIAVSALSRWER